MSTDLNLFVHNHIYLKKKIMNSEETIKIYCGNIRQRLLACRTKSIALILKERLCEELGKNCTSHMVNNVLKDHVDMMIREIFNEHGYNKYLENTHETY